MMDEKSAWFDVVVVSDTVDGDADPGHLASRLRGSGFVDRTMGNALPSRQSCRAAGRKGPTVTAANWIGNRGNKCRLSACTRCAAGGAGGTSSVCYLVVDPTVQFGQPAAGSAPPRGNDLRGDAHRGLLRGARAEVQADR